jgi:hypothetical protein
VKHVDIFEHLWRLSMNQVKGSSTLEVRDDAWVQVMAAITEQMPTEAIRDSLKPPNRLSAFSVVQMMQLQHHLDTFKIK